MVASNRHGYFRSVHDLGLALEQKSRRGRPRLWQHPARDEGEGRRCCGIMKDDFLNADSSLLQRFRDGDRLTLDAVYRSYVGAVTRTVTAALRRYGYDGSGHLWRRVASDLPDLVQEVFMRAFEPRTRHRFDGSRAYGPFLCQIARNVVVDFLRRKGRQVVTHPLAGVDAPYEEPPFSHDGHAGYEGEQRFADLNVMAVVARYVAQLSPELRRVHEALYVLGLSQREAAATLGLGRQVVRTLEARLRNELRSALQCLCVTGGTDAPIDLGDVGNRDAPELARGKPGSST